PPDPVAVAHVGVSRTWALRDDGYKPSVFGPNATAQQPGPLERQYTTKDRPAAPVCLYVAFRTRRRVGSILDRGVARRSFGLLRYDLLLQIDPSASGPRAGYVLRRGPLITSFLSARRLAEDPRGYGPFLPPCCSCEGPMLPQHAPASQSPRR